MIPKILHTIWFANPDNPLGARPDSIGDRCMASVVEKLSGYTIMRWGNGDIGEWTRSPFFKKHWDLKHYAYCADYARMAILYEYGGFYIDTDVELFDSFDKFAKFDTLVGLERHACNTVNKKYVFLHKGKKYQVTNAIIGFAKNHQICKSCIDLLDQTSGYDDMFQMPMHCLAYVIKNKYNSCLVNSLKRAEEAEADGKIPIYVPPGFDEWHRNVDYSVCTHKFVSKWSNCSRTIMTNSRNAKRLYEQYGCEPASVLLNTIMPDSYYMQLVRNYDNINFSEYSILYYWELPPEMSAYAQTYAGHESMMYVIIDGAYFAILPCRVFDARCKTPVIDGELVQYCGIRKYCEDEYKRMLKEMEKSVDVLFVFSASNINNQSCAEFINIDSTHGKLIEIIH